MRVRAPLPPSHAGRSPPGGSEEAALRGGASSAGTRLDPAACSPCAGGRRADSRRLTGSLCGHAAVQPAGSLQVHPGGGHQSSVHPGVRDGRVEGDLGEEGAHLLVPDLPPAAASPRNDNNAEEPQRKRLQMVNDVRANAWILFMRRRTRERALITGSGGSTLVLSRASVLRFHALLIS